MNSAVADKRLSNGMVITGGNHTRQRKVGPILTCLHLPGGCARLAGHGKLNRTDGLGLGLGVLLLHPLVRFQVVEM